MKMFFGGTFMDKEALKEEGKNYPIKLEYYKVEEEEKNLFGVEIVKTEYKKGKIEVEKEMVEKITDNEKLANRILDCLKEFQVTPIVAKDVIQDLMGQNRIEENKLNILQK